MRITTRGKPSAYEVRCSRCDVTFPAETRTCLHCGGPTGAPSGILVSDDAEDYGTGGSLADYGAISGEISIQDVGGSDDDPPVRIVERDGPPGEAVSDADLYDENRSYEDEHGPPSFVQSLMRSMGSVIWIVILIAFSLSRSCGN